MGERVTIKDVAAHAGVAISSVSSALNGRPGVSEATRRRIQVAAAELGFVPSVRAQGLAGKRTFAVGLVVHRDPDVLEYDPFFGGFIGGIESYIEHHGYALVLQATGSVDGLLDRYRNLWAGRRVDGVFLNELEVDDPRIELVQSLGMPAVGINADDGFPLTSVRQDFIGAVDELVSDLVGQGHRRFALVTGPERFIHSHQRLRAWVDALAKHGITDPQIVQGGFTFEAGARAAAEVLAPRVRPTVALCPNDLCALGMVSHANELGYTVPEDISIAGFDGIQLGELMRPALTTVRTSPRAIGYEAARLLLATIEGEDPSDVAVDPAVYVRRGSTAVPASSRL